MSASRINARTVMALACWVAVSSNVCGQETLTRAKDLYASAAYEEALAVIDTIHDRVPADDNLEVAGYRIFCLIALDRTEEARREIQHVVRANPLYRLSGAQASPRTRALFDEERNRLLPEIVQQTYVSAKEALDRKEMPAALSGFERTLLILEEPGLPSQPGLEDLRTLAIGFRDLIRLSMAAPGAAATASQPAPATSATKRTTPALFGPGDAGVVPPVAINQIVPPWNPQGASYNTPRKAMLELVIDESGAVVSAVLKQPLHPSYDSTLLRAARQWKFHAATKDGVPVRYRKQMEIVLTPKG